jgi:hypothetical protein
MLREGKIPSPRPPEERDRFDFDDDGGPGDANNFRSLPVFIFLRIAARRRRLIFHAATAVAVFPALFDVSRQPRFVKARIERLARNGEISADGCRTFASQQAMNEIRI